MSLRTNIKVAGKTPTPPTHPATIERVVVDSRGRIVIPARIRNMARLAPGAEAYLLCEDNQIRILRPDQVAELLKPMI